ncbi:hypothetical protein EV702DRAFT_336927 [Suillus placidus]|uniref:Uncharacterized protein n=1 Tax=Suillus placidus TaxID=48579 RepID=A0A9P6ZUN0_9AGAM|nr:hypothetical protein EV702DRAFT_336927 [Suillus placidus]
MHLHAAASCTVSTIQHPEPFCKTIRAQLVDTATRHQRICHGTTVSGSWQHSCCACVSDIVFPVTVVLCAHPRHMGKYGCPAENFEDAGLQTLIMLGSARVPLAMLATLFMMQHCHPCRVLIRYEMCGVDLLDLTLVPRSRGAPVTPLWWRHRRIVWHTCKGCAWTRGVSFCTPKTFHHMLLIRLTSAGRIVLMVLIAYFEFPFMSLPALAPLPLPLPLPSIGTKVPAIPDYGLPVSSEAPALPSGSYEINGTTYLLRKY